MKNRDALGKVHCVQLPHGSTLSILGVFAGFVACTGFEDMKSAATVLQKLKQNKRESHGVEDLGMVCQCLQVDVLAMRSKVQRVHLQIKDICAILSGLVVAQNYKKGQQLITDRSFKVRPKLAWPRMLRLVLVIMHHLCRRVRRMAECCPSSVIRLPGYNWCCISFYCEEP